MRDPGGYGTFFSKLATENTSGSDIRDLLKILSEEDVISFAGGIPNPKTFPVDVVKRIMNDIYNDPEEVGKVFQYQPTSGVPRLRTELVRYAHKKLKMADTQLENVFISSGSQEGLSLSAFAFINKGDVVVLADPTYLGAIAAFKLAGATFRTVPMEDDGINVTQLDRKMRGAKLLYLNTNFQNPSGTTLSAEKREAIYELAQKHDVLIVEDNPYGRLRYDDNVKDIPDIKIGDTDSRVIYLGSFSKVFAPGARIAFVIAAKEIIEKFVLIKQATSLQTNAIGQYIIWDYLWRGEMRPQIKKNIELYKRKRDLMAEGLREHFPKEIKWVFPHGGMFFWLEIPEKYGINTKELLNKKCVNKAYMESKGFKNRIAFVPGTGFYANGGGENTIRLNFTRPTDERIRTGTKILGQILTEEMGLAKR